MTTLVEDLKTLLDTLGAAGGVHNMVNEANPIIYPFVVFQRVASDSNVALLGPSLLQNTRVQIDIYSRSIAASVAMEALLESTMNGWSTQNVPILSQDFFDEVAQAYRVSKDYSLWASN